MRSKDVSDGQQVEIPVLQYNRTVGTQRESTSGNGKTGTSEVGVHQANPVHNLKT